MTQPPAPTSVAPWESRRSTLDPDRGYYGEAPVRPAGRFGAGVGGIGAGGSAVWGQAGSGWATETRETGKRPEPGHRLARDPSGKPSNLRRKQRRTLSLPPSSEPGPCAVGSGNSPNPSNLGRVREQGREKVRHCRRSGGEPCTVVGPSLEPAGPQARGEQRSAKAQEQPGGGFRDPVLVSEIRAAVNGAGGSSHFRGECETGG